MPNGVVALQADWTNGDPVISQKLESLGGKQVPVVAIFPAGRAQQPIVLSGFYTQGTLLQKLQDAYTQTHGTRDTDPEL